MSEDLKITEDFKRDIGNGWRVGEPYSESIQADYVRQVTEELKAIPRMKRPPTTTQTPEMQKLLDAQAARPLWKDAEYIREKREKELPAEAQVRREDGSVNTGARCITDDDGFLIPDAQLVDQGRKRSKNTIGQGDGTSVPAERREKGIQAFTYSKPANLGLADLKRVKSLSELEAIIAVEQPKAAAPKMTLWDRIRYHFFAYEGETIEAFLGNKANKK